MELKTGYVVVGDYQFFRGYTLFLCKKHKKELHDLGWEFRKNFLTEMSIVAEAVSRAFKPQKLNYELLGNNDHHLHWHIFPRHKNDPLPGRTVWNVPKGIRENKINRPDKKSLTELKSKLRKELNFIIKRSLPTT